MTNPLGGNNKNELHRNCFLLGSENKSFFSLSLLMSTTCVTFKAIIITLHLGPKEIKQTQLLGIEPSVIKA